MPSTAGALPLGEATPVFRSEVCGWTTSPRGTPRMDWMGDLCRVRNISEMRSVLTGLPHTRQLFLQQRKSPLMTLIGEMCHNRTFTAEELVTARGIADCLYVSRCAPPLRAGGGIFWRAGPATLRRASDVMSTRRSRRAQNRHRP